MKIGPQELLFIGVGLVLLFGVLFVAAKIKKAGQNSNTTTRQP